MFSHSCQWFWSAQMLRVAYMLDVCSFILVSGSNLLKHWRGTHILDACSANLWVVVIYSSTGEGLTNWICVQWFLLVVLICLNTGGTHLLVYSAILIRSDLLKHWKGTHKLDACSAILFISSDLIKHWRGTYKLNGCSAILVSGFGCSKIKWTHLLDACSDCQWFWLAQKLERNSLPGFMFSHSC